MLRSPDSELRREGDHRDKKDEMRTARERRRIPRCDSLLALNSPDEKALLGYHYYSMIQLDVTEVLDEVS